MSDVGTVRDHGPSRERRRGRGCPIGHLRAGAPPGLGGAGGRNRTRVRGSGGELRRDRHLRCRELRRADRAPVLLRRGACGAGWRRCLTPRAVRRAARAGPPLRLDRARAFHAHPPARRDRVALAPTTAGGAAAATHRRGTDRPGQHRSVGLARFLRQGRPGRGRLPRHRTQDLRQWLSRRHAADHQRGVRRSRGRADRAALPGAPSPPKA